MGLLLVIFAHCYSSEGTDATNMIRTFVYGFHMPLFYMMSGMLWKKPKSLKESFKKNFFALIVPWIIFNIIVAIGAGIIKDNQTILQNLLKIPYNALIGKDGPAQASWFIFVLFIVRILYDIATHFKIEKHTTIAAIVITLISAYLNQTHYTRRFFFAAILMGFIFFSLGKMLFLIYNKLKLHRFLYVFLGIGCLITSFFLTLANGKVSTMIADMGDIPILFYINALIGSSGIIFLAKCFEKSRNIVTEMSNASTAVVLTHLFFVDIVKRIRSEYITSNTVVFFFYLFSSIITYLLCVGIFKLTYSKIPWLWGKPKEKKSSLPTKV